MLLVVRSYRRSSVFRRAHLHAWCVVGLCSSQDRLFPVVLCFFCCARLASAHLASVGTTECVESNSRQRDTRMFSMRLHRHCVVPSGASTSTARISFLTTCTTRRPLATLTIAPVVALATPQGIAVRKGCAWLWRKPQYQRHFTTTLSAATVPAALARLSGKWEQRPTWASMNWQHCSWSVLFVYVVVSCNHDHKNRLFVEKTRARQFVYTCSTYGCFLQPTVKCAPVTDFIIDIFHSPLQMERNTGSETREGYAWLRQEQ